MEWPCREDEKLIVKKVYVDRVEDADWRGRSLGRQMDRMCERDVCNGQAFEQAKWECLNRER